MSGPVCAPWCAQLHDDGQPCESDHYTVEAITAAGGLRVSLRRQDGDRPLIDVEEIRPDGRSDVVFLTPIHQFTPEQAAELRDALAELVCFAGACGCCHGAEETP